LEAREVQLRQERIREPAWGRTGAFYHWLIDFYFFVVLPLNCIRACGALVRDELQADTLGFLVTRPLSRARLLLLKYLSQTAWLQVVLLLETLLLFFAGNLRQIPHLDVLLPLFLAAQILAVPAWSALGLLFGQITHRYMAVAVVYGLIVEMGIGRIPTNINTLSLMRQLKTLLSHNPALQTIYDWYAGGVPLAVTVLILAPVLFLTAAALLFTFLEYHPSVERQK
jgi:ABC-type transport system involved in multi-copper enzyme maturation permease subunit